MRSHRSWFPLGGLEVPGQDGGPGGLVDSVFIVLWTRIHMFWGSLKISSKISRHFLENVKRIGKTSQDFSRTFM